MHGIVGFDFSKFDDAKLSINNESYDFPYLRLLIHLWPGKSILLFELFDSEQEKESSLTSQEMLRSKDKVIETLQGQVKELVSNNKKEMNERAKIESGLNQMKQQVRP